MLFNTFCVCVWIIHFCSWLMVKFVIDSLINCHVAYCFSMDIGFLFLLAMWNGIF